MPPTFFGLPIYEAAQRLAADFGIDTDRPPTKEILEKRRQQTESQQLMENERLCFAVLSDYARVMRDWKVRYAPQSPDAPVHARFVEACHKLDEVEHYLDILCAGDSYERAEVVSYLLADGRLDFPAWFDGKDVNEAAFAGSFCQRTSSSMRTTHFSNRTDG